jgi:hypothetical protein
MLYLSEISGGEIIGADARPRIAILASQGGAGVAVLG